MVGYTNLYIGALLVLSRYGHLKDPLVLLSLPYLKVYGVLGNNKGDPTSFHIEDTKLPKYNLMRKINHRIYKSGQTECKQAPKYKIKASVWRWTTSNIKRIDSLTVLAHLRYSLSFMYWKNFHISCNCDGRRLNLHHILFNCGYFACQRTNLIYLLQNDHKDFNSKTLFDDNPQTAIL